MTKPYLKLPAIAVSQPVGEFFLCSIPAAELLKLSYSIPATMTKRDGIFDKIWGNQRVKSESRAKQIGSYIDENESTFPNSIILSVNYFKDGSYAGDESIRWRVVRERDDFYSLIIPTDECLASIIDGQHRLEGFRSAQKKERLSMTLPCAVFINLPRAYQARIFATININQKRVDKSLAYQLFGYDLNEANANKWPPDMLGVYLSRILEGSKGSPFEGHIKLALLEEEVINEAAMNNLHEKETTQSWAVSVACIVEGVTRLISEKPVADKSALANGSITDRSALPLDNSPLRRFYIAGLDKTILGIITAYFKVVEEYVWAGQPDRSFAIRTVGVLALFDVLRDALKERVINIDAVKESTETLFESIKGVDFSDDFFHASGAGRVRIRNVIKHMTGLSEITDESTLKAISRLV